MSAGRGEEGVATPEARCREGSRVRAATSGPAAAFAAGRLEAPREPEAEEESLSPARAAARGTVKKGSVAKEE